MPDLLDQLAGVLARLWNVFRFRVAPYRFAPCTSCRGTEYLQGETATSMRMVSSARLIYLQDMVLVLKPSSSQVSASPSVH